MPIRIFDRQFTDFRGRSLTFLKGNAGDYMQKFQYDMEIDFSYDTSATNPVTKNGNEFTIASGSWSDFGFLSGQVLTLTGFTGGPPKTGTIDYVDGNKMYFNAGSYTAITNGTYIKGIIRLVQLPETVDIMFNLLESNGGSVNEFSVIDGEAQRFRAENVDTTLSAVGLTMSMSRLGNASGGSNMSVTLERLADAAGIFRFRVYSPFRIWIVNKPSTYQSTGTVDPYFKVIAYPDNTALKTNIEASRVDYGNCGYVNESYNGGKPQYKVDYINWTDASTNPIDAYDYNQNCDFTIKIDALGTNFSASHVFNFFMFLDPKEDANYKNLPPAHENNIMMASSEATIPVATPTTLTGYADGLGAKIDISNLNIVNNTTHIIVTGQVQSNAAYKTELDSRDGKDKVYKIWLRCEDPALTYALSDAMNVLVEENISVKLPQPLGAYPDLNYFDIEDHNSDVLTGSPITEDDLKAIARFTLPKYHIPTDWLGAGIRVVARNSVTNEQFTLEETSFWFGGIPNLADGTRPLIFSQPTGFKLPPLSDKLNTTLRRYVALDTVSDFGLEFNYAHLIRWEDWIEQLNAANDFFGSATKDWRAYDITTNWDVLVQLVIQHKDGYYIDDKNYIGTIRNYNDWTHNTTYKFYRLDATLINNPIQNEVCRVQATFTLTGGDTWAGNEYGTLTVEAFEESPRWLMSSVLNHGSEIDNPLQVMTGEVKLKKTISGGNTIIDFECLFDPDKFPGATQVKFTAEVDGDTTISGHESNRFEFIVPISPKPISASEEDRGFEQCCEPFVMLVDTTDATSWKNDVTSAWGKGDTVTFNLKDDKGNLTTYVPTSTVFPNNPGAYFTTIQWRDVVALDGFGCYSIEIESTFAGLTETILWGKYNVQSYTLSDGYRMSEGQVRLKSVFNDNIQEVGIDFTGAFVVDVIRFEGKFWNWKTNTEVDNIRYTDNVLTKVKREDIFDYELTVKPHYKDVITKLLFHLRHETSCWVSDYNRDNHIYYLDLPVIVKEGFEPTSFKGDRKVQGVAVLQDKLAIKKSNYHNNGEVADFLAAPPIFKSVYIRGDFATGIADLIQITIDSDNAGTYTLQTDDGSSGSITFSVNGGGYAAFSSPFVLNAGDTLDVKRTVTTGQGWYKITGALI